MLLNFKSIKDPIQQAVAVSTFDPDWFCESVLCSPNDVWQSECLNAIADLDRARVGLPTLFNHELKNRFSICAFHGPGKTHWLAKLMHWFNFTRKGTIPCTGPKEKILRTRLWPEFRKLLNSAAPMYQRLIKVNSTSIVWAGDKDWTALIESANQLENLAGYHADNLLFVVEEGSGIKDDMFSVIEGALTTPGSVMAMIGNPIRNQGEFFRSHNKQSTSRLYYKKKILHSESSRVSKSWVDNMRAKYGEQSPIFKTRVMGEFVNSGVTQLVTLSELETARLRNRDANDGSVPLLVVSADVGDGIDPSVITVGKLYATRLLLLYQRSFNFEASVSPLKIAEEAVFLFNRFKGEKAKDKIVIDGIGVGAGAAGKVIELEHAQCLVVFKGSHTSVTPGEYRNMRSQCYISFKNILPQLYIADEFVESEEDWDEFADQICAVQYAKNIDTNRGEDVETKQDYMARMKKSPDRADSAIMIMSQKLVKTKNIPVAFSDYGTISTSEVA